MVIVPLLFVPAVTIVLILDPVGIFVPVILCPVPSSKCVSNTLVPVWVALAEIVIEPYSPVVLMELIKALAWIPVPLIFASTTRCFVLIFVIDADPLVTFPPIINCLAGYRVVVVILVIVEELRLTFPVIVRSVESPSSGWIAPPIHETIAEAPEPSVLVLSKNKGSP